MIDPKEDGITHINIYSKGTTELGKWLSNFTYSPFKCKDGNFNSIEGYWYWLLSDKDSKAEVLRKLYGFEAKKVGRELKIHDWPDPAFVDVREFRDSIYDAFEIKLNNNTEYKKMLKNSKLPFFHYYIYGDKVVNPSGCGWILDSWEHLRFRLRNE